MKVKRPKVGDVIRFCLRYGSAPAIVLARIDTWTTQVRDSRDDTLKNIKDIDVCYINGKLTGNGGTDDEA